MQDAKVPSEVCEEGPLIEISLCRRRYLMPLTLRRMFSLNKERRRKL
jgi:hypothetical protein